MSRPRFDRPPRPSNGNVDVASLPKGRYPAAPRVYKVTELSNTVCAAHPHNANCRMSESNFLQRGYFAK